MFWFVSIVVGMLLLGFGNGKTLMAVGAQIWAIVWLLPFALIAAAVPVFILASILGN